jgi:thiamine pyrophosphate-dependent acetolactate synthase large subunit-like protein
MLTPLFAAAHGHATHGEERIMKKGSSNKVDRRKFLAGVAITGAAAITAEAGKAAILPGGQEQAPAPALRRPSTVLAQAEISTKSVPAPAGGNPNLTKGRPGSDFMLDVIKTLDIDYVFTNPASSCRGLHDSIVTYGDNKKPELITAMHEESATAMSHGYFKVAGKPAIAMCHGTVGLQHATMGIYNAWCDRVPIIMMTGNSRDANQRRPDVPTVHSVQDPALMVRDMLKWDDQPGSLQHFAESLVRAYRIAMTPPHEPVLIVLDTDLQEMGTEDTSLHIPKFAIPAPPAGESNAVREVARLLVAAERPVIVADRVARSEAGVKSLVQLAEALNATVIDQGGRMNFPNLHPLYARGTGAVAQADVILGLELTDFFGTVNEFIDSAEAQQSSRLRAGAKLVSIGSGDVFIHSNYQDFQRYQAVDIAIAADAEATLPSLVEAVKVEITPARRAVIEKRGQAAQAGYAQAKDRMRADAAAAAWNASPVSSARLCAELWPHIRNEDWALVGRALGGWPQRMWNFDKHYQAIGGAGGAGVGYNLPAAVGAALAHKEHGRFAVNIQPDGDCMYAPGAIWTLAHHKIPMLTIMNNNRAYHQEVMHLQRMAAWRQRRMDRWHIATTIRDPYVSFAKLADAMGVAGIGPIENPNDLGAALKKGVDIVKSGEPVVIDVVMQPR